MGHSTPTVTAKIYSDLYADELDQVATNLDQLHATENHTPKTGQEPDEPNPTTECRVNAGR
jgi:integrase